jgi:hypothetical protein
MFWSPVLRALRVSITGGNYEQDRATIFNDLTVDATVALRIASLSIASIFRCAVATLDIIHFIAPPSCKAWLIPPTKSDSERPLLNHSYRR